MKEKFKNLKIDILVFIIFLIPIATIVLNSPIIIGDEIWNFQNVMKLSRGLELYKDCNVIVTPMFFYIGKIFLKVIRRKYIFF